MFKLKVRSNTQPKVKFSFRRHILPPLAGLLAMVIIFGTLNAQWIIAQATYRFHKPLASSQPVQIVAPTDSAVAKSPNPAAGPQISIPKINVKAPVVFDEPSYSEPKVQLALRKGVLRYGSTASPGQKGNVVIFGHSSGQLWAPGNYKFVFTLLDKLQKGDQIFLDYQGTRYTYSVTGSKTIAPTDLTILDQTPISLALTLVTCTPVGTSKQRLVVYAEQVSPKPANNLISYKPVSPVTTPRLPSSASSSLWQTLLGWI